MVFTALESVLSSGHLTSVQDVSELLLTMEDAILLIGPQLKHNLTKLDTTETGNRAQSCDGVLPQILLADSNISV